MKRADSCPKQALLVAVVLACLFLLCEVYWLSDATSIRPTADNLAERNYPELIYEPIDVVYTWVNGSDPRHAAAVLATKLKVHCRSSTSPAGTGTIG
tara:strand:- start:721 stop:1011 length:291 start_codon:yes stop_codon:yes gene_type:complete